MKKNNVENILSEAVRLTTPDILDSLLSDCEWSAKGGEVINMDEIKKENSNKKGWGNKLIATAAAFAIVVGCALGFGSLDKAYAAETFVSVDAGSNVTVGVDEDNVIVSVSDNNSGIKKSDVKGKNVKDAMGTIVKKMVKNGDISNENNIVLLSVEDVNKYENEGKKEVADEVSDEIDDAHQEMQEELADAVDEVLQELGIKGDIIGQKYHKDAEVDKIAHDLKISPGKASFIKKILEAEHDDDYDDDNERVDINKLAGKSINEIVNYVATHISKNGIEVKDGNVSISAGSQTNVKAGNSGASSSTNGNGNVNVNVGEDANVNIGTNKDGSFNTHVDADNGDVKVDVGGGTNSSIGIEVDGERFVYDSSKPGESIIGIIGSIIKAS